VKTRPEWRETPDLDENHIVESYMVGDEEIAAVEYFGQGSYYPRALNKLTGNWERGGPMRNLRDAMGWAERVATGAMRAGDERARFYY
jgi:hypothetical protein